MKTCNCSSSTAITLREWTPVSVIRSLGWVLVVLRVVAEGDDGGEGGGVVTVRVECGGVCAGLGRGGGDEGWWS